MFGLSFKEKTAEALRRGTNAALTGGFFHYTEAQKFGLNDEATSWLYTEALAHQIYMLGILYKNSTLGKYKWATYEFSIKSITDALTDHEIKNGLTPGSISSFVFKRCHEIDQLTPKDRETGEQYCQSAKLVAKKDPSANQQNISKALENAVGSYFEQARKMFGI